MLTIIRFTFREVLRKRVLGLTLLLTGIFLALYGVALHYVARDLVQMPNPVMAQMLIAQLFSVGLYLGGFICSFLAILLGVGTISGEIENGTMGSIVPKPIRRHQIVLGKFFGYALMLVVYATVFFLALMGLVYWQTAFTVSGVIPALLLFCLQPLVLLSVAMWGTTVLSTVANGIVVFMLYALATIGGMIEQIGALMNSTALVNAGIISSLVMPADAIYRRLAYSLMAATDNPLAALQNMGPFGSQSPPSNAMLIYTLVYMAAVIVMAVRSFNRRDI